MKLKTIKLLPTDFCVDVWIGGSISTLAEAFSKRYGASIEYYKEDMHINSLSTINSSDDSELKGHTRFVMILQKKNNQVIVHEVLHLLWHMNKRIGLEMSFESQEWQACMFDYVFSEIIDNTGYECK
jgi:hypothetical protein